MSRGQPRDPHKEQFWRDVLSCWPESGLTIRAYCRQRGVSEPSFYAWRRLLAQRQEPARPADAAGPVTFVPLTVQSTMADRAEPPVELILANGRRLRLPVGVAASVVRDLLVVLEETPC
jgi:transposase-like protein